MSVIYNKEQNVFILNTKHTSYMIGVTKEGYVGHIYYGSRIAGADPTETGDGSTKADDPFYLLRTEEAPFTPSANMREKGAFLDFFPMEYPSGGTGDYRESCIRIRNEAGQAGSEFLFDSYRIEAGKPKLSGLPASFGTEKEVTTLVISCRDAILGLVLELSYSVFEECDVITRSVKVINEGTGKVKLEKVYSACIDMDNEDFEMISLHGSWARERHIQRTPLMYGRQNMASFKGESSHQEHPFIALVSPGTTQTCGKVYGMHFVYSGNFIAQAELSQFDSVRMVMGIHPEEFCWNLLPKESFQAPEAVLVYSDEGLGKMTRSLHDFYRNHMIRSPYLHKKRPILINNWEATYFDFNTEKLLDIARDAKKAGIEMLVMDDGWFGKRNSDDCSLGDWKVNETKITGGLKNLVDQVNEIGLEFGIWFEPEMISPDSDLYRTHPDWAIHIKGREATQSRQQYVLDLSNPEVREHAYESVASILRSANISYVKWDMNRQLTDLGSSYLDADSQQELYHRYVLGVYELQERLVTEFPDLLLENCSGGGARFDPGMLYYSPQIWCSDDTDAMERLTIQEGTAMIYPLSVMGAHVSDVPNHACGRVTPFETRGNAALSGTFGYELDITKIPQQDREMIPYQVEMYHKYNDLIREGDYYRIASFRENHVYDAYMSAAKDGSLALLTYVQGRSVPNVKTRKVRLFGLEPTASYKVTEESYEKWKAGEGAAKDRESRIYSGDLLMKAGLLVPNLWGDGMSRLYRVEKV